MNFSLNDPSTKKCFSKNFSLFKSRFPNLASIIDEKKAYDYAINGATQLEFVESKNGELTATYQKKALHSLYNVKRESLSLAQNEKCSKNETTIFFSYGLGYSALEFAKNNPEKRLLIIESDLPFAFLPFLTTDLSDLFSHKKLILLFGLNFEEIIGFFENQQIEQYNLLRNPTQTLHNQLYFDQLEELLERNKKKIQINNNTLQKFGKLWCRNVFKNFAMANKMSGVENLKDKFKGQRAIVLAAGPSLAQILPLLKKIQEKCIVICVDTALKHVIKAGIIPDFTILMDSQYWNSRHLDFTETQDTVLISESSVHHSVFRHKWKNIFLCDSQYPLGKIIEKDASYGKLGSGGSVATCSWDFARFIGCNTIFMAGLDLGYSENQTHIKGSTFETKSLFESDRLDGLEKKWSAGIFSAPNIFEKNYEGGTIRTDSRMQMYAWWFESKTSEFPDIKTYNLGIKSLFIANIKYKNVSEIFELEDLPYSRKQISKIIEQAAKYPSKEFQQTRIDNIKRFMCLLESEESKEKSYENLSHDEMAVLKIYSDSINDLEENLKKITKN